MSQKWLAFCKILACSKLRVCFRRRSSGGSTFGKGTKCLSRRLRDRIPRLRSQSVVEVADVLEKSPTPKLQTSLGVCRRTGKCLSRRLGDVIPRCLCLSGVLSWSVASPNVTCPSDSQTSSLLSSVGIMMLGPFDPRASSLSCTQAGNALERLLIVGYLLSIRDFVL